MTTTARQLTADELLQMPNGNVRRELVKGEVRTMSPAGDLHGLRTSRITIFLGHYVVTHNLGETFGAETGFLLQRDPDTVRAPDFAFLSRMRLEVQGITGKFYPGAPDLAVEVLSPSDSASEVLEKIDEWIAAGTRLVWVIDPQKKTIAIHAPNRARVTLRENDQLDGEDVVPGFRLAVSEIFR